jgi:hypothetical protein
LLRASTIRGIGIEDVAHFVLEEHALPETSAP